MIRTENVTIGSRAFIHTYSDSGAQVVQADTGYVYDEAFDLVEYPHTYTEREREDEEITDTEALNIITGGEFGNA